MKNLSKNYNLPIFDLLKITAKGLLPMNELNKLTLSKILINLNGLILEILINSKSTRSITTVENNINNYF